MNRPIGIAALVAASALLVAPAAQAHVTLQPTEAPAGGFKRVDVRVPNERAKANTNKVEVKFPPGFIFISYQPVAGWKADVKMKKLAKPVEVFGEKHTEEVDSVTFTTKGEGVTPGQFQDFGLSLGIPDKPKSTLTFKALQTYDNGEVVRWIGPPDADQPAPQVKVTPAADESGSAAKATQSAAGSGGDDSNGDTLAIVALVIGALGLLAGGAAFARGRRVGAEV